MAAAAGVLCSLLAPCGLGRSHMNLRNSVSTTSHNLLARLAALEYQVSHYTEMTGAWGQFVVNIWT